MSSDAVSIDYRTLIQQDSDQTVCELLAEATGLSKSKLKDAQNKGAVWLQRGKGKQKRLRRASYAPRAGDLLTLHYRADILAQLPTSALCLEDFESYSLWYKPPGVLSQGNQYSDHTSLLRQAELHWRPPREAYLIHRLDREAAGLMLVAHKARSAALLSQLFAENAIKKTYRAEVRGLPAPAAGLIESPLDGKPAMTEYSVEKYDPEQDIAILNISIRTGRLHQIRRHLEIIGHPVMGDPKYGRGNKDPRGLQLTATRLEFRCPLTRCLRSLSLEDYQSKIRDGA